jgi:hypothetical protein
MSPMPSLQGISDIPRTKNGSPIKDFIYPSTPF